MSAWRLAGLNYVQYSNIAARCVRAALKQPLQVPTERQYIVYYTIYQRFGSVIFLRVRIRIWIRPKNQKRIRIRILAES